MKKSRWARSLMAFLVLMLLLAAGSVPQLQTTATVRFHHLHFRTADVSAALADTVQKHGGSRVLLQGLGVGVRLGDHYLLFDSWRALAEEPGSSIGESSQQMVPTKDLSERYRDAVQWLIGHGVVVTSKELGLEFLSSATSHEVLDHVAFATGNVDAVVQTLRASGATEVRRTEDSAFFRVDGAVIEITRDTELPDVLWCPMHPDVRAGSPGKCPICSMDLVPIPPPRIGQYRLVVTQRTAPKGRGASALTLQIRDPQSGDPVTALAPLHERLLHLFIISRDLRFFVHEHPVQNGDRFRLAINLGPGHYMMVADFLPAGGSPQMVHRALVTPGYSESPFVADVDVAEDGADKSTEGVRVQLSFEPGPGRLEAALRFTLTDEKTGVPLRDLQPYLGASGHLLIVSTDLAHAIHAHPEGTTSGPEIGFNAEFPTAGLYKMWVQVQRGGKVLTAPFVVRVGAM